MLLFCLNTTIYLSPQLLVYMPIHLPVHYPTCSFWLFHSDKPFVLTCPLACCSKYLQIYLSSINRFNLCVFFTWLYMHTYLSTHLLVCLPTDPPENECTCSFWCNLICKLTCPLTDPSIYPPIMFILIPPFRLTRKIYLYTHLLVQRYYYFNGNVCWQIRRFHRCINHLNYLWAGRVITVPTCLQWAVKNSKKKLVWING